MKHILYLAWKYLSFNRMKTIVLVGSISLILFLPAGLYVLVEQGGKTLTARAESTPLLIGPIQRVLKMVSIWFMNWGQ